MPPIYRNGESISIDPVDDELSIDHNGGADVATNEATDALTQSLKQTSISAHSSIIDSVYPSCSAQITAEQIDHMQNATWQAAAKTLLANGETNDKKGVSQPMPLSHDSTELVANDSALRIADDNDKADVKTDTDERKSETTTTPKKEGLFKNTSKAKAEPMRPFLNMPFSR